MHNLNERKKFHALENCSAESTPHLKKKNGLSIVRFALLSEHNIEHNIVYQILYCYSSWVKYLLYFHKNIASHSEVHV